MASVAFLRGINVRDTNLCKPTQLSLIVVSVTFVIFVV
jgi:hypothetical protein